MATITLRTDPETERALAALTADGVERSQAIRQAIVTAARLKEAERLREEAKALANDPDDVAEARAVLADMESLRAW
jgi:thioredoxin-like negative regulator of GroEL